MGQYLVRSVSSRGRASSSLEDISEAREEMLMLAMGRTTTSQAECFGTEVSIVPVALGCGSDFERVS